jgi:hypothetical protein
MRVSKGKELTGFDLLASVFGLGWQTKIADIFEITPQAVQGWILRKKIPESRLQAIVDASGGRIKSVDDLRG